MPRTIAPLAGLIWLALAAACAAHDAPPPEDRSGYPIPAIQHGAMAVLSDFRTPILDLAATVTTPDAELAALGAHNDAQRARCLWLLVPGSVTDEASPLNLCAHAETAGLKAILERLRRLPQTRRAAAEIVQAVEWRMMLSGTFYAMCEHSGETFNTASQIRPDYGAVPGYLAARFAGLIGLFAAAGSALGLAAGAERIARRRIPARPSP